MEEKEIKLGKCCGCEKEDSTVRNIVMLPHKTPGETGTGWGCVQCNLPLEGAEAVLCDECFDKLAENTDVNAVVKFVCSGYPKDNIRVPFDEKIKATHHDHILAMHPEHLAKVN